MKFTIDGGALNKALRQLSPAMNQNRILPILDNLLCNVKKNKCLITATNTNLTITVTVACNSSKEFEMLLPFKELLNISSVLSSEPLTIEDSENIMLTSLKEKYKLGKRENVDEFPKQESFEETFSMEIDSAFLSSMQLASKCVSKTLNEYVFQDVCIDIKNGLGNVISTDKMQLFRYHQKAASDIKFNGLIDTNFIKSLAGLEKGTLIGSSNFLKVEGENVEITGRLSEQKFPDYSIFFKEYKHNCSIEKSDLIEALDRMMIFEKGLGIYLCKITFKKGKMVLNFNDVDLDRDFETEINATHSVDFDSVFFNAFHLKNLLSLLPDSNEINLSFIDAKQIVHIDSNDSNINAVIIPIKQN